MRDMSYKMVHTRRSLQAEVERKKYTVTACVYPNLVERGNGRLEGKA